VVRMDDGIERGWTSEGVAKPLTIGRWLLITLFVALVFAMTPESAAALPSNAVVSSKAVNAPGPTLAPARVVPQSAFAFGGQGQALYPPEASGEAGSLGMRTWPHSEHVEGRGLLT
jgi:hypothetical protein